MKRVKTLAVVFLAAMLSLALFACGSEEPQAKDVKLSEVMTQIEGQVTLPEMMDQTDLMGAYGIEEADVKQSAAKINTGNTADEIVLIEAVDADAAARVKDHLDDRYENLANQAKNYQPDQYAVIEKCEVKQQGNFVTMIISPDAEKMIGIVDGAIK